MSNYVCIKDELIIYPYENNRIYPLPITIKKGQYFNYKKSYGIFYIDNFIQREIKFKSYKWNEYIISVEENRNNIIDELLNE